MPAPARQHPAPAPPLSFDELYAQHADHVFAWAMRYARGNTMWAEDVAHDVFVRVWQRLPTLREADVRGWLFRVTHNLVFTRLRRERFFLGPLRSWLAVSSEHRKPETPDELLGRRQSAEAATATLNRLPPQERMVMGLLLLDGLKQREIATTLSLSEGHVSKLVKRAKARLSKWGWEVDVELP